MLRRLYHDQPESFAFTPANAEWANRQISKYPEGRQASAVIPILWRAQEQEGWVTRPIIEEVAKLLSMEPIRVLEVATFYFMFQLRPVGSVAHVQICGTTSCMICGAEDLVAVCKDKIAVEPHALSPDGNFSWEEVECLGACANAPMAQIGKDYYEDLTADGFAALLDAFARGEVPSPGPQNGRWASEPAGGFTSLDGNPDHDANASVHLARELGETIKRIDGTERTASDLNDAPAPQPAEPEPAPEPEALPERSREPEVEDAEAEAREDEKLGRPEGTDLAEEAGAEPVEMSAEAAPAEEPATSAPGSKPELFEAPPEAGTDDLKKLKGIGPKLEELLHTLGVYRFDQIASWSADEVAWVDAHLEGFNGRIERDEWVTQAREITGAKDGEA